MTDEQAFLDLMRRFGIAPERDRALAGLHENTWTLKAEKGGVKGYGCFVCDFVFDKDGKFVSVGVWE